MYLKRLSILNFKNCSEADINFSHNINCFVGDNGEGKTNILDAIYYLSFCKSFFNSIDNQNIKHNEPFFVIQGYYINNKNEDDTIYCGLKRNQKKHFKLNENTYSKLADHIGLYPLVMVSPSDIEIISGGSEERRRFINGVISQYDKHYLSDVIEYTKAVTLRNSLLKQFAKNKQEDYESIELINDKLIEFGTKIYLKRKQFISDFKPIFEKHYKYISDNKEDIDLIYETNVDIENYSNLLKSSYEKDKILQYTTVGIHKDDLDFSLTNYPIKKIGSEGQKKSYLIALKLAKFDFIKNMTSYKPILLLDDIFDKLDDKRVAKIITLVKGNNFGQIFITDTNSNRIEDVIAKLTDEYAIFNVKDGIISPK